jgi:hypothetical protein
MQRLYSTYKEAQMKESVSRDFCPQIFLMNLLYKILLCHFDFVPKYKLNYHQKVVVYLVSRKKKN